MSQAHLTVFQKFKVLWPTKDWNFPKAHSHFHMFHDIRLKGVTRNFNSKPNESAHRPLKKFYLLHTNFKNVDEQVLTNFHSIIIIDECC